MWIYEAGRDAGVAPARTLGTLVSGPVSRRGVFVGNLRGRAISVPCLARIAGPPRAPRGRLLLLRDRRRQTRDDGQAHVRRRDADERLPPPVVPDHPRRTRRLRKIRRGVL